MSHNFVVVSLAKSVSRNLKAYGIVIVYRVLDSEFGGDSSGGCWSYGCSPQVPGGRGGGGGGPPKEKKLNLEYSESGFEAFQDSFGS